MPNAGDRGFSLVETAIALSMFAVVLSGLANLAVLSARANADARRVSLATIVAGQKMEELRSLAFDLPTGPASTLDANTAGFCDFLDDRGRPVGSGIVAPVQAMFTRRWSIQGLPADPVDSLLLQVVVVSRIWHGGPPPAGSDPRRFGGAELASIKKRRAG